MIRSGSRPGCHGHVGIRQTGRCTPGPVAGWFTFTSSSAVRPQAGPSQQCPSLPGVIKTLDVPQWITGASFSSWLGLCETRPSAGR
jgi:hypothetical protein